MCNSDKKVSRKSLRNTLKRSLSEAKISVGVQISNDSLKKHYDEMLNREAELMIKIEHLEKELKGSYIEMDNINNIAYKTRLSLDQTPYALKETSISEYEKNLIDVNRSTVKFDTEVEMIHSMSTNSLINRKLYTVNKTEEYEKEVSIPSIYNDSQDCGVKSRNEQVRLDNGPDESRSVSNVFNPICNSDKKPSSSKANTHTRIDGFSNNSKSATKNTTKTYSDHKRNSNFVPECPLEKDSLCFREGSFRKKMSNNKQTFLNRVESGDIITSKPPLRPVVAISTTTCNIKKDTSDKRITPNILSSDLNLVNRGESLDNVSAHRKNSQGTYSNENICMNLENIFEDCSLKNKINPSNENSTNKTTRISHNMQRCTTNSDDPTHKVNSNILTSKFNSHFENSALQFEKIDHSNYLNCKNPLFYGDTKPNNRSMIEVTEFDDHASEIFKTQCESRKAKNATFHEISQQNHSNLFNNTKNTNNGSPNLFESERY